MADMRVTDTSRHGPTARSQRLMYAANVLGLCAMLDLGLGVAMQTKWGGFTDIVYVILIFAIPFAIAKARQIVAVSEMEFDFRSGAETRVMKIRAAFRKYFTIQVSGIIPIALSLLALAHWIGGDTIIPFVKTKPATSENPDR